VLSLGAISDNSRSRTWYHLDVATLGDAYASWRQQPFPSGSTDDALDEIHADLVLVDHWVAQSVIPFVEQGRRQPAAVDVLGTIAQLRARAAAAAAEATDDHRQLAIAYGVYAELMGEVYRAFLDES
jgi:hypothetical protein